MNFFICSGVFFPVLQQYVIFPSPHYFQKVFLERSYFSYLGRGKSNIFKSIWTKHIAIWPYNILNTSKACVDVSAKFPKNTSENVVLINLTRYGFSTQWFSQIVFAAEGTFILSCLLRYLNGAKLTLHKMWSFALRISSVNVTKYAENCRFGHIYWRNP